MLIHCNPMRFALWQCWRLSSLIGVSMCQNKFRPVIILLIWIAWLMFGFSFFLPATNVLGTLSGWDAFIASFAVIGSQPLVVLAEPRVLICLAFPFCNMAMLLSPLFAYPSVTRTKEFPVISIILIPSGILPWLLPKSITGELFSGFYLWNLSFFLMSVADIASVGLSQTDTWTASSSTASAVHTQSPPLRSGPPCR